MNFQDYLEPILKPISSDEPCGSDPKYENLYEGIRGEVAKMSGIGHGAPDWEKVERDAMELLTDQAKEINLLAYLASAMVVNHGLEGFTCGFNYFAEFLKAFWAGMFPPLKKVKIRARAMVWLNDRVLEQKDLFKIQDREQLEAALQAVKSLKDAVYEYFSDPPTKFSGIRNQIQDQLATLPEPKPEEPEVKAVEPAPSAEATEQPPTEPVAQTAPAPSTKPALKLESPSLEGVDTENLKELKDGLMPLVSSLLKGDPALSLGYLLNRELVWINLKTPKSQAGQTMVPAPVPELRNSLKTMQGKANWSDLLARCEALLVRWPYWLDIQYYAHAAASNLGETYQPIAATIQFYARKMKGSWEELLKLKFDDGTPFAGPMTKQWFREASSETGGGRVPEPDEELAAALAQKSGDDIAAALEEAESWLRKAPSRRIQFIYRTEMARFFLSNGQKQWALAALKALKAEIDAYKLESWEPAICGPVWSLFLEALPQLPEDTPQLREMIDEARARLCATRIDLAAEHQLGLG